MGRSSSEASLALWRERFATGENVGRTAKELAALFGVHVTTIQYWRSKLAAIDKPQPAPASTLARQSAFVPVRVHSPRSSEQVVVKLPGEVVIYLPADATGALVTVLTQLQCARRG